MTVPTLFLRNSHGRIGNGKERAYCIISRTTKKHYRLFAPPVRTSSLSMGRNQTNRVLSSGWRVASIVLKSSISDVFPVLPPLCISVFLDEVEVTHCNKRSFFFVKGQIYKELAYETGRTVDVEYSCLSSGGLLFKKECHHWALGDHSEYICVNKTPLSFLSQFHMDRGRGGSKGD